MTRTLSIDVSDDAYERFHALKADHHPDPEGELTHAELLDVLLDRGEGERRDRPDTLYGVTERINIPRFGNQSGKCYVNVNVDEFGHAFEVFVTVGDSGGEINSWADGLAKTLSNALRAGVDVDILADDLMGIRGPHTPATDAGDDIYSVPDAVGVVLRRFADGKLPEGEPGSPEPVRGSAGKPLGPED